jgi:DegV family protein with EDD domain
MQFVTDSGTDLALTPEEIEELNIHIVPLMVTLSDNTYREGVDISEEEFYQLLEQADEMPVTSQPSAGELAEVYRKLAETDPDIMSIHISSGLSGTYSTARLAAELVTEANVNVVDTKTLSAAAGWQVEMAAKAAKAGWPIFRIKKLLDSISNATDSLYTLDDLKYLIHGGRISHMKGLLASVLKIRPIIGVEKSGGTYVQLGQVRTFRKAMAGLVDQMLEEHEPGSALRVQVMHAQNQEGADALREMVDAQFDCTWLPTSAISLVLGAHTGPSMVAVAYATQTIFDQVAVVL